MAVERIKTPEEYAQDISRWASAPRAFRLQMNSTELEKEEGLHKYLLTLTLPANAYRIFFLLPTPNKPEGYMGGSGTNRRTRFGEDWLRGNDLADGPYGDETWRRILGDIISYELRDTLLSESNPNGF